METLVYCILILFIIAVGTRYVKILKQFNTDLISFSNILYNRTLIDRINIVYLLMTERDEILSKYLTEQYNKYYNLFKESQSTDAIWDRDWGTPLACSHIIDSICSLLENTNNIVIDKAHEEWYRSGDCVKTYFYNKEEYYYDYISVKNHYNYVCDQLKINPDNEKLLAVRSYIEQMKIIYNDLQTQNTLIPEIRNGDLIFYYLLIWYYKI